MPNKRTRTRTGPSVFTSRKFICTLLGVTILTVSAFYTPLQVVTDKIINLLMLYIGAEGANDITARLKGVAPGDGTAPPEPPAPASPRTTPPVDPEGGETG